MKVSELVNSVSALRDPAEAAEFMRELRASSPHADVNVGYCIGYIGGSDEASVARRRQLHEWTTTKHPVFESTY